MITTKPVNGWDAFLEYLDTTRDHLLQLKDGWADYRYNQPFDAPFIDRVLTFAKNLAFPIRSLNRSYGTPSIGAQDGNSIDLHWYNPTFQLLINLPEHESEKYTAAIFGHTLDDHSVLKWHGSFTPSLLDLVFAWIKTFHDIGLGLTAAIIADTQKISVTETDGKKYFIANEKTEKKDP
jgi:hypothetical protein